MKFKQTEMHSSLVWEYKHIIKKGAHLDSPYRFFFLWFADSRLMRSLQATHIALKSSKCMTLCSTPGKHTTDKTSCMATYLWQVPVKTKWVLWCPPQVYIKLAFLFVAVGCNLFFLINSPSLIQSNLTFYLAFDL